MEDLKKLKRRFWHRSKEPEDILPGMLKAEVDAMMAITREIDSYRLLAINTL